MIISALKIDEGMYEILHNLYKHHDSRTAENDFAPLEWYVNTGRASTDFLRLLFSAKPFMIARQLHKGGTYEEAIQRIKTYIGYSEF